MPPFPLVGSEGTTLRATVSRCIVSAERMPQEVPGAMDETSRGAWGWMAAFALLVSMGMSWRLLPLRDLPESGAESPDKPGLLASVSRSPEFSFGFRNVLADVVWLEAVQSAGNLRMTPRQYDRLSELLDVVANFDPKFEIPYLLGGLVLGGSTPHARKAVRVLERGKGQFPGDWRFPFYIGFTHYFSLGDAAAGGAAMAEAARLPGSPVHLAGLASRMFSEARDPDAALAFLDTIAGQETDAARRAVLEGRRREIVVERDLQAMEKAIERYREKARVGPGKLADLVRAGLLPRIPAEPNGGRYLLGPGGVVRSDRVPERMRVFRQR